MKSKGERIVLDNLLFPSPLLLKWLDEQPWLLYNGWIRV